MYALFMGAFVLQKHLEELQRALYDLPNLRYLQSGFLQKKFADFLSSSNHGNLISPVDEWFGNEHKT